MAPAVTPAGPGLPAGLPAVLRGLDGIEAELARLWREVAGPGPAGDTPEVLRAASFNLVVVAPSEEDGQAAAGVLAALMAHHPGRMLVLCVDPAASGERLAAWVTMHCRAMGPGPQVCGEEIVITAAGGAVERVARAVDALLFPDCPVVAWWRGGPDPAAAWLDRLAPSVDACLVDGTCFAPVALASWLARFDRGPGSAVVGDLAWERTRPWRAWTADCFEPPARRLDLRALRRVRVDHGPRAEMVAWLYVAWLAARLGWRADPGRVALAGGGVEIRFASASGPVSVTLRPRVGAAGLAAVVLDSDRPPGLRCALTREEQARLVIELTRGADVIERRLLLHPEPDEAVLIGQWLERLEPDPTYAEALAMAGATDPEAR